MPRLRLSRRLMKTLGLMHLNLVARKLLCHHRVLLLGSILSGGSHPDSGELSLLESLDLQRSHLEARLGNCGLGCKQQRRVFIALRLLLLHVSHAIPRLRLLMAARRVLIRFMAMMVTRSLLTLRV